ncbi:hypothetical protein ACIPWL_12175 [Streptomyces sp. NPDC090023]|uniref:hypothetical protein n=1 Tax=unclassified Streptomyces TaxID=2593676 RepID=UPI0037FAFF87
MTTTLAPTLTPRLRLTLVLLLAAQFMLAVDFSIAGRRAAQRPWGRRDLRGPAPPPASGREVPPGTAPRRTAESPKYVQYEDDSTARRGTAPDAAG